VLLALVSLAFQTFVVQTHIHHRMAQFAPIPGISALTGDITDIAAPSEDGQTKQGPRDPFPGDDPNCTLCQAAAHSGQFLHSAAVLAHVPAWVSVHFILFNDVLPSVLAVSHSWQGRAPPQN
jgi:hypothetical protein